MNDDDLRKRFIAVRETDARGAPAFSLPEPSRRSAVDLRWAGAMTLVVLAAGGLWLADDGRRRAVETLPRAGIGGLRWTTPTDYLLETPGRALLRSVPSLRGGGLPAPAFTTDGDAR